MPTGNVHNPPPKWRTKNSILPHRPSPFKTQKPRKRHLLISPFWRVDSMGIEEAVAEPPQTDRELCFWGVVSERQDRWANQHWHRNTDATRSRVAAKADKRTTEGLLVGGARLPSCAKNLTLRYRNPIDLVYIIWKSNNITRILSIIIYTNLEILHLEMKWIKFFENRNHIIFAGRLTLTDCKFVNTWKIL